MRGWCACVRALGLFVLVELAAILATLGEEVSSQLETLDVPSAVVEPEQG